MSHLSAQDRAIFTKVFLEVDRNGDGYLDMTEMYGLCLALGFKFTPAQVHEMFIQLDEDKNHKVTLDEFLKAMQPIDPAERACAHLRRLFVANDKNKDGFLSVDELQATLNTAVLEAGVSLTRSQTQELLSKVDINGDGKLDYEEFLLLLVALSA